MSLSTHSNNLERPPWIRIKLSNGSTFNYVNDIVNKERLNTVCFSAACPNKAECWNMGTATFMILGNLCTRSCRFCNVATSKNPLLVDADEPQRLLNAVIKMRLKHVVITSVARDDLSDGGALQFAKVLSLLHQNTDVSTEVLVPDFLGNLDNLQIVLKEKPIVFNHNLETIKRLTPKIRSKAQYQRSLEVLKNAKMLLPTVIIKSGLMLGLGENDDEIKEAILDLKNYGCEHLTLGQYLQPSKKHHAVQRFAPLETFIMLKEFALSLGFKHVVSGPLVRSSYHAKDGIIK